MNLNQNLLLPKMFRKNMSNMSLYYDFYCVGFNGKLLQKMWPI